MALVEISKEELLELKELYKVDWPLHVVSYFTIKNFIDRFEKFPAWSKNVKFFSLKGDWRKHATFIMANGHFTHFNSLEPAPHEEIRQALMLFNFLKFTSLNEIRNIFQSVVHDVIKKRQLEVESEFETTFFVVQKELYPILDYK